MIDKEFQSDRSGFVLKVDLDIQPPEEWLAAWERKNLLILGQFDIKVKKMNKAKTTKGWHYWYLSKKWLSPEEINKLQFLLGDDHTRVRINAWRIERKIPHWNKLFDRKLWRKEQEYIQCWYCGNKIPIIAKVPGMKGGRFDVTNPEPEPGEEYCPKCDKWSMFSIIEDNQTMYECILCGYRMWWHGQEK